MEPRKLTKLVRGELDLIRDEAAGGLRSDQTVSVRLAALSLLWQSRLRFSAAVALVQNAAEHDPAAEVRRPAAGKSR